jgi:hypothetical protein
LIWLIAIYREISKEITIKQTLKKRVRTFLYEHTPEGVRHPSDFWHRVRHDKKNKQPIQSPSSRERSRTDIIENQE